LFQKHYSTEDQPSANEDGNGQEEEGGDLPLDVHANRNGDAHINEDKDGHGQMVCNAMVNAFRLTAMEIGMEMGDWEGIGGIIELN
jgi:hypothetical protein